MQIDFLFCIQKTINSRFPFRIGKEIVIEYFYMLTSGIELYRLHRMYASLFVVNKTERAVPDAAAGEELNGEVVLLKR